MLCVLSSSLLAQWASAIRLLRFAGSFRCRRTWGIFVTTKKVDSNEPIRMIRRILVMERFQWHVFFWWVMSNTVESPFNPVSDESAKPQHRETGYGFFNQPLSQQSHEKCAIKWIKLHLPARPPTGLDNRLTRALEFQRWRQYNLLVSHNSNLHVTLQFIPKIRMPNEFYCTWQWHSFAATVTFDSVILNKDADNCSDFYESIRLQWWSDTDTLFRSNIDTEHDFSAIL